MVYITLNQKYRETRKTVGRLNPALVILSLLSAFLAPFLATGMNLLSFSLKFFQMRFLKEIENKLKKCRLPSYWCSTIP